MPATAESLTGRRDSTRERLLVAARTLFVSRGYHLTRPQDIARLAGVGYGTFYLYFNDKQACFLAFVSAARRELEQYLQLRVQRANRLDTYFAALIDGVLDYAAENPDVLRAATTDTSAIAAEDAPDLPRHWAAGWAQGLQDAIRRGAVAADYDPEIVGAIVVGAIGGAMDAARRGAARDAVIANAVRFLMRALEPRGGCPAASDGEG
jgi:AcrR family transcriptional regulator